MNHPVGALLPSPEPLVAEHDLVMFDLDGVVYISGRAVEGAPEQIDAVREAGCGIAFVTNNAARTPDSVAAHLTRLGVRAEAEDVVTSAQAAARLLADRFAQGERILVLGSEGLIEAVQQSGLTPVLAGSEEDHGDPHDDADDPDDPDDQVVAAVTGYGPEVVWRDLMRVATRIRNGLPWVASNSDMTIPTDYGIAPGHGVQVAMLRDFTGVEPEVAGKPSRPLLVETMRRVGGDRPLMVGDRLDTDIEGARVVDVPSLLVLTGVTGLAELVSARPEERPDYLHTDLRGLHEPHPEVRISQACAECGGWEATVDREGVLTAGGRGNAADWWRAVASAAWAHLDATGDRVDYGSLDPPLPDTSPGEG